jgi:hypothetical protein
MTTEVVAAVAKSRISLARHPGYNLTPAGSQTYPGASVTPDNEQPATPPDGDHPRSEPPVSDSSPLREPSAAAAAAESAEPPPADDAAAVPAAEEPPRRAGFSGGALIGAAVLGAAIALAVGAAATVFLLPRDEGAPALAARLGAVELAVRDLSQPAPPASPASPAPASDTRALDDVASRVAKLEAAGAVRAPGASDAAFSNRLAGLEGEVKALADTIGALGRRSDDATAAARDARAKSDTAAAAVTALAQKVGTGNPLTKSDLDSFDQRVAALERSHKLLEAELAKSSATSSAAAASGDKALRLAFAATALKAAVERGEPFAPELATVKALGADSATLAPLAPFAASGVPSAGTLARELAELAPMLRPRAGTPRENFLQRLQVNAEKLVRVRPVDEAAGADASGGARIDALAAQGDLAGALAELVKLPPAERAPAETWIKQAQARTAAIDASRRLAADSLAGLGK